MAGKLIILLSVAVFSKGAVVPAIPAPIVAAKLEELEAAPHYSFAYDVQDAVTGDSKAQYETRNGDLVQGSYSLIEADGTRRIVEYTADPINGFNAVVSREPATAVTAIAAPLLPYAPAIAPAAAAAPVLPAAPAPAPVIPASGPDSDVEVVEARSGPLIASNGPIARDEQLRQQQEQQLQQLKEFERQQQEQQQKQLQQLQQLQQQSRLRFQQQIQQQQRIQQEQGQQQEHQKQQSLQRQQSQQQQQTATPVKALVTPVQLPEKVPQTARLVNLPATKTVTTFASYPNAYAYTTAYSSPLAYAPIGSLTYASATTLL
ncbi:cuticular protein 3 precursor [Apis mellifera caucasica]|uniref:Cuticular protein 3 precursor n=1 Tax=Apis mellifera TaxID=7460 RepID=A0A7M6UEH4_APIME|nr:cuticular protein 3 precursor [Apis mellifera]KAG6798030.1 cuticular protein 3 precursor [Apis mellifera caucasica]KAG9436326.1 cuticular protein 3 precursor [Apis mellifera carnica]|eukprot:NP_001257748.1 cuticular protein 3 precursor [Apis mellifera]